MLTPEELQTLEHARQAGFYLRSGQRLAVLLEWRRWCRQTGRRCIVARCGAREAVLTVDGADVQTVAPDDLQAAARQIAKAEESGTDGQLTIAAEADTLWAWAS